MLAAVAAVAMAGAADAATYLFDFEDLELGSQVTDLGPLTLSTSDPGGFIVVEGAAGTKGIRTANAAADWTFTFDSQRMALRAKFAPLEGQNPQDIMGGITSEYLGNQSLGRTGNNGQIRLLAINSRPVGPITKLNWVHDEGPLPMVDYITFEDLPAPVPLPAAGLLLAAPVMAGAALGRRRRATSAGSPARSWPDSPGRSPR